LLAMLVLHAAGDCASEGGCASDTDDISALATRHVTTQHGKSQAMLRYGSGKCAFSDDACAGNQCCQGVNKTGGKTYPCPSADRDWNECEMTDLALLQWNPMGCGNSPSALKHGITTETCVEDIWWIGNCGFTIAPCVGAGVSCEYDRKNRHLTPVVGPACDDMFLDCDACIANLRYHKNLGENYNYGSLKCNAQGDHIYIQGDVCQIPGCR